ncbi:hypothetical protein A2480_02200 [Candidatus Uhrbacteria bacterium RIFOXYC2_FULL_47_19]|uniref:Ribose 5-phosphate isomerase B n=1 Tax=Candidatus Uhrbacteria bacterium RIFOXYC2_FULL_47_19 TaxID=1802424 RepID=A0A1F7WGP5_9BACT|nr:MAG: hypothetical protein A2480_02200 [Candidatus Uhrbacteria bacterium RIFOXYC2_FULL_47_19]HCC21853.1 ribose-5-phosphate isomerase [Candidatus Uhrbacteria bacterium]
MPDRIKPIIHLAADHAAYELKEELKKYLTRAKYEVVDQGAFKLSPTDDYPDFILPAAEAVAKSRGRAVAIVMGGSGIGECIVANKVSGVRAALAYDSYTTRLSRQHNDANVLCLGSRTLSGTPIIAKKLVNIWLRTSFTGEARHRRRLKKITSYEKGSV